MNSKIKSNLFSIQHILVALVLIPKGLDKIEHHHIFYWLDDSINGNNYFRLLYLSKITKTKNHFLLIGIHLFESISLFLTSYVYFEEGKKFLPYVTLIAAIGFLVAMMTHITKIKKQE
ncbi:MAG: hypothetical protein IPF58_14755 [Saprospirales bacterium]|nr:hypothetical protein [Saprospirales bacterium]